MALTSHNTTDVGTWALLNALIRALRRNGVLSPDMVAGMTATLDELTGSYDKAGDPVSANEISEVARLFAVKMIDGDQAGG